MNRTYRDPQLLKYQAAVGAAVVGLVTAFVVIWWPDWRALLCLAVIPVFVVTAGRASRQGVRTDEDGLTVRDQWNHERRLRWPEIEQFEIEPGEGARAHTAYARLRDGTKVELEPLGGAEIQASRHRRRWTEQSVDALNAQLRQARGSVAS